MTRQDIILLTIDCWRYDAIDRMNRLISHTENYTTTETVCQSAATHGVFASIFNSTYYPQTYTDSDSVKEDVRPLPAILADRGYSTGGFAASNPRVDKWAGFFERFWNGERKETILGRIPYKARNSSKFLLLKQDVSATETGSKAKEWYESVDEPRFLWMHLMDLHGPTYPGFRRGIEGGLVQTYASLLESFRADPPSEDTLSDRTQQTIQELYWQCVDLLDERIEHLLSFVDDDATVIIMGDHGHEFDHGLYKHSRLYDECVRVPLLVRWTLDEPLRLPNGPVRQLDIAPTILDALGIDVPDDWEGSVIDGDSRPSFMLMGAPQLSRLYTGLRTEEHKLIKTFEQESGEELDTELYDLVSDPDEINDIYDREEGVASEFEEKLEEFCDRIGVRNENLLPNQTVSKDVERRLKELGYM